MPAEEVVKEGPPCLLPFVPLMRGGERFVEEAERRLYEGGYSREEKADLLTGMALLGGLVSREIPVKLLERRRDLMIESAAYEIIKKEGFEEGIKQGIQQGLLEEAREMVLEALEERFGVVPLGLVSKIKGIQEREVLKGLLKAAIRAKSLEEFKEMLKRVEEE